MSALMTLWDVVIFATKKSLCQNFGPNFKNVENRNLPHDDPFKWQNSFIKLQCTE